MESPKKRVWSTQKWIAQLVFVTAVWLLSLLVPLEPFVLPAEQQARGALEVPDRVNSAHQAASQFAIRSLRAEPVGKRLNQQSLEWES